MAEEKKKRNHHRPLNPKLEKQLYEAATVSQDEFYRATYKIVQAKSHPRMALTSESSLWKTCLEIERMMADKWNVQDRTSKYGKEINPEDEEPLRRYSKELLKDIAEVKAQDYLQSRLGPELMEKMLNMQMVSLMNRIGIGGRDIDQNAKKSIEKAQKKFINSCIRDAFSNAFRQLGLVPMAAMGRGIRRAFNMEWEPYVPTSDILEKLGATKSEKEHSVPVKDNVKETVPVKDNVKETVPVKDDVKENRETEKNIGTVNPVIDSRRVWTAEAIPLGSDTKGNDIVAVRQSGISGGISQSKWHPGSKFYLFKKNSEGQLSPMSWKEFTDMGKDVGQKLKTIVSAWNKAIEMDSSIKEPVDGYTLVFQGAMAKMSNEHVLVETTSLDDDHKRWQQSHAEDFSKPNTGLSSQKDHGLMATSNDVQATLPSRRVPSQSMQERSDGGSTTKKEIFISSKDSLKEHEHQDQSDNRHTHSATKDHAHSGTKDYGLGR